MKKLIVLITMILIGILAYLSYTGFIVKEPLPQIPAENGSISIYFCPHQPCEDNWITALTNATTVDCALYDLNSERIITALKEKQARIIIEKDNYEPALDQLNLKKDINKAYMHNKFCILDNNKVITGSTNPTTNDLTKNNNNLLIITSKYLAENYQSEFNELWESSPRKIPHQKIILNNFLLENYFCPEDNCEENVVRSLSTAQHSIYFMTFSFTSDNIGKLLEEKSKTIEVKGVFEKRQNSQYSEFARLNRTALVRWDNNPHTMHHKVFIIDNETVITGSFNPTKNANEHNDENVLIIHDPNITQYYLKEFEELYGK